MSSAVLLLHTVLQVKDEIEDDNIGESGVTGITDSMNQSIVIPSQILQEINSTGAYMYTTCMYKIN